MKRIVGKVMGVALLAIATLWVAQAPAAIKNTKHDLSVNSTGATIKATSAAETQICVFCHVPHNSSTAGPLWNRANPAALPAYTPYTSTTMNTTMGQPDGTSLLCLSCHDGTLALGDLLSRGATRVALAGVTGTGTLPAGNSNVGRDLSDDHPVSIVYDAALATADGQLANPATLTGKVRLWGTKLQCTSCHDAHDSVNGKFLVMSNNASALCIVCHTKTGWAASDHATKTTTYTGANITFNGTVYGTPWTHTPATQTTVASNACENCHRPHTAPGAKRLLNYLKEEDNCLVCHNGTAMTGFTAKNNIAGEYVKASAHTQATMSLTAIHDPTEAALVATKHVECVDCHNPHQAQGPASTNAAGVTTLAGPLTGARGIDIAGAAVAPVTYEYQICFRCHSSNNVSVSGVVARVARQIVQTDTRLEFQTTNPSYHPIAGAGKGTNVPSLIAPWATTSTMKCTHCHNNNTGPINGVAGTGPNGPHASTFAPILNKNFVWTDTGTNSAYNAANFALCYTCHNATAIYQDAGPFNRHQTHLNIGASCSTCHDPHGVGGTGTVANNSHLINFNTAVVTPSGGILRYTSTGVGRGSCQLVCHGQNHNPLTY